MGRFRGFTDAESFTDLPDSFFEELLRGIHDQAELKVSLYALWRTSREEGEYRALRRDDFSETVLGLPAGEIEAGLGKSVESGFLLRSDHEGEVLYFLNSPRGREAAAAHGAGRLKDTDLLTAFPAERPNVFKLYEENIGPLTPLIADALKDAEATYSAEWTADAIELAAKNNKRSWKYCEAILKRWKDEGRGEKQNRRDAAGYDQRDVEEKYRKFIEG
jgi:DnaD/phage-associated family protein